jgi:hypothetical protein
MSHKKIGSQQGGALSVRRAPRMSATAFSVGTKKTGNDGNLWKVEADINGRHTWIMARNKSYNLSRTKSRSKSRSKSMSRPGMYSMIRQQACEIYADQQRRSRSKSRSKLKSKPKSKSKSKTKSKSKSKKTKSRSLSRPKVRMSPTQSATLYKVGTKKVGNDGNKWIIVENTNGTKRWKMYKKNPDPEHTRFN